MPEGLTRWSTGGLLLGCGLLAVGDVVRIAAPDDVTSTLLAAGWVIQVPGAVLVLLGTPAVFARRAGALGRVGLLGVVALALFLLVFGVFAGLLHGLVLPAVAVQAPGVEEPTSVLLVMVAGAVMGMLSTFLLGIATWRAGVLPRWAAGLMIVGGAAMLVGHGMPLHVEDDGLAVYLLGLRGSASRPIPIGSNCPLPHARRRVGDVLDWC